MTSKDDSFDATSPHDFQVTDPARAALAQLEDGLTHALPLLVITGERGMGKTMLLAEALKRWGKRVNAVTLADVTGGPDALLPWAIAAFGDRSAAPEGRPEQVAKLAHVLETVAKRGATPLIVVDGAERLAPEMLAELGRIESAAAATNHTLKLVLVGNEQLRERLASPALAALAARTATHVELRPLSHTELRDFLNVRAAATLGEGTTQFSRKAARELHARTNGVPSLSAAWGDAALAAARKQRAEVVGPEHVRSVRLASTPESAILPRPVRVAPEAAAPAEQPQARPAPQPRAEAAPAPKPTPQPRAEAAPAPKPAPQAPKPAAPAPVEPTEAAGETASDEGSRPLSQSELDSSHPRVRDWVSRFTDGQRPVRFGGRPPVQPYLLEPDELAPVPKLPDPPAPRAKSKPERTPAAPATPKAAEPKREAPKPAPRAEATAPRVEPPAPRAEAPTPHAEPPRREALKPAPRAEAPAPRSEATKREASKPAPPARPAALTPPSPDDIAFPPAPPALPEPETPIAFVPESSNLAESEPLAPLRDDEPVEAAAPAAAPLELAPIEPEPVVEAPVVSLPEASAALSEAMTEPPAGAPAPEAPAPATAPHARAKRRRRQAERVRAEQRRASEAIAAPPAPEPVASVPEPASEPAMLTATHVVPTPVSNEAVDANGPLSPRHKSVLTWAVGIMIMFGVAIVAIIASTRGGFEGGGQPPVSPVVAAPVPAPPPVPMPAPAAAADSQAKASAADTEDDAKFCLSVGTYLFEDRAKAFAKRLAKRTGRKVWVETTRSDGTASYRILFGGFATEGEAERMADRLLTKSLVNEAMVQEMPAKKR